MMKVTQSLVATLVLCAVPFAVAFGQEPEATAVAVPRPSAQGTPTTPNPGTAASATKIAPLTVTVELIGGTKLTGTLTDVMQLPLRTSFGEASVPLAEVAGVKLASAEDNSTTVILKNGDSITGATDLKLVSIDTEWGSAKINASSISSLLLLPDLKWNATNGLSGRRWSLVDSKLAGPASPGTLPGTTKPATSPTQFPSNPPLIGR